MAKDIDVFLLLKNFAARAKIASIDYKTFAAHVQRQAMAADREVPVYRDLSVNPDVVLLPRLYQLAKERKITLSLTGNQVDRVTLPDFYSDLLANEYRRIEENPDIPFPEEDTLKVSIPNEWIQAISIETDLFALVEAEERPVPFYRLLFPEGIRSMICQAGAASGKLHELAVLKIRHYLRKGNNKDFVLNKLMYAFQNKEALLRDTFGDLLIKPFETLKALRESTSDFTFPFWAYLSNYIKRDLAQKPEKTAEDWALMQSVLICEIYTNFYKGKTQRRLEREAAFKALDQALRKPPFHFSLDEIVNFRDARKQPLLGRYDRDELEEWLREKTTVSKNDQLPEILLVVSSDGRRWYAAKDRLLQLAVKLIGEARQSIRTVIINEWRTLMFEYRETAAMTDDEAFRRDLLSRIEKRSPILNVLVRERYLPVVHAEMRAARQPLADLDRYFSKDELVPIDDLLDMRRKQLVSDVRMLLPLWYSVPILSTLYRMLKGMKRRKSQSGERAATPPAKVAGTVDRRAEFAAAAARVEKALVPAGATLDGQLSALETRWNTLLNENAKKNLREDIDALVRDYLRGLVRTMKPSEFTVSRVEALAAALSDTPSVRQIRNPAAVQEYIKLYMVKCIKR